MLHKERSHCNKRPPLAATRGSSRAAMKTQHSPQKDKPRKLCTQSRENTPKVGSTLILPATCIPLPEDTDLLSGPCSSWQDFFEITLPPALGERQHFQALCHHHHAVRCPGYITLLSALSAGRADSCGVTSKMEGLIRPSPSVA